MNPTVYAYLRSYGMSHADAQAWATAGRIPPRSVYMTAPKLATVKPGEPA